MTDPTSKELLYCLPLSYQEKYKLANMLKLGIYLPPENFSPVMEMPQDIINIICKYTENIWDLKVTCQHILNVINQYQSTIREIKIKHNYPLSKIQTLKKYYTGIQKLTVQQVLATSGFSMRLCDRRPNLQMTEFLTWNNLKILELEDYDNWTYIEDGIICVAMTIIIRSNVDKFMKVLANINLPKLEYLEFNEVINGPYHNSNDDGGLTRFSNDDGGLTRFAYLNMVLSTSNTLKSFTFYIQVSNDDEMNKFLDEIKCKKPKNIKYVIESREEIKRGRRVAYKIQVKGIIE